MLEYQLVGEIAQQKGREAARLKFRSALRLKSVLLLFSLSPLQVSETYRSTKK